jgi:hypothetical protein
MPRDLNVYILHSPDGKILGCFSSLPKAKIAQDQWHCKNFIKPFITKSKIE